MDTALRIIAVFILLDVLAAVLLIGLVTLVRRKQSPSERTPFGTLFGALVFLAIVSILIYGGIWMLWYAAS